MNDDQNMALVGPSRVEAPATPTIHPFVLLDCAIEKYATMKASKTTTTSSECLQGVSENDEIQPPDLNSQMYKNTSEKDTHFLEILEVADFLFGSLLDSALVLLDSCSIPEDDAHSCHRRTAVRKVSDSSGRVAYFVRATAGGKKSRSEYLCLMNGPESSYYCSCRSFYERLRHASNTRVGSSVQRPSDGGALCKHLLAAKMATLLDHCLDTSLETEERFVQMMVQSAVLDL